MGEHCPVGGRGGEVILAAGLSPGASFTLLN